jgi:excisionase family DNA binding protein
MQENERHMSTFDAAEILGVSIRTVQQWMEKGILTGWKTPGGHRRLFAAEVYALAEKRRSEGGANASSGKCRILVIEDDPDICRLYQLMSRNWRTPVEFQLAHDGLQGLILLGEYQPDFVILDLNIPKVDGFELIQSIHAKLGGTLYRYCVVTGMNEDDIRRRGSLPEGCPVLIKPVDFARLEQLVAKAHQEVQEAATTGAQ